MRKLIANEWMTLDGVVQAPGYADEDTSGGFRQGGWHLQYFDDLARKWVVEGYAAAGGFVFGRRTYELLASYWPNAPEEEEAVAGPLNTLPKHVASRTLSEPLEWPGSNLLGCRHPEGRGCAEAGGGQGLARGRQQRVDALVGRTRPRRRVPAHDRTRSSSAVGSASSATTVCLGPSDSLRDR
jgi:hypothetical protein